MKILFIAPHLSTGGMPQYLYKQIEALSDLDVYCIEWDNVTGGVLVVQRNRILSILGDKLITLGENKEELLEHINRISPDIIHLQEIPEMFMSHELAEKLYSSDRTYKIIETSHDSSYDVSNKKHFPDKFMMVSQYQIESYKSLNIPCELVEYPIEYKTRTKTREELMSQLGLDPNKKHVITVGLFTPRKNQAEVIEYAKMLQDQPIQFHFIGNQADNFKYYWEPIMKDFPSNCTWWGERTDVDVFYQMADLFLFTSRGHANDKETMPLVIREAISWKIPSLIYNLDVYLNYFNNFDNIKYLSENSIEDNANTILNTLNIDKTKIMNNYDFTSRWSWEEQKMFFVSNTLIDVPIIVSIREYMSDGVLWACNYDTVYPGVDYWISPVSRDIHFYGTDPEISGTKICIYIKETSEKIYEEPHFKKFVSVPRADLSLEIPYHMNYAEFFIKKKYNRWFNRKYDNVVDAGSNVGVFVEYLLYNELTEKIVAVECDSKALKDLYRNFKREPRVEIIPKALNHNNDEIVFYHSEENPVISSTLSPDRLKNHVAGVKGDDAVIVETVTIADLVNRLGVIDLLKIDIEGAEYEIIEKLDPVLFNSINNLFIECHFFEDDYLEKYNNLVNKLRENGYNVEEFEQGQSVKYISKSEMIFATKK
jgi:glycosyltransferase involved in cell wall biosynthesis